MRSRSIDNYLSHEERELITAFLQLSLNRFEKYDGLIRIAPQRFNSDELQKLYIDKLRRWEKSVKTEIPDSSSTYYDVIRESEDMNSCPIEDFLKAFMQVIQQAIPPSKHSEILLRLENDLVGCNFLCPCPAEP